MIAVKVRRKGSGVEEFCECEVEQNHSLSPLPRDEGSAQRGEAKRPGRVFCVKGVGSRSRKATPMPPVSRETKRLSCGCFAEAVASATVKR